MFLSKSNRTTNDKDEVSDDNLEMNSETNTVTDEEQRSDSRSERFWDYLTMVSSLIYAIGLVTLGLAFYFADIFIITKDNWDKSAVKTSCMNI
jgi:hypothetical protein